LRFIVATGVLVMAVPVQAVASAPDPTNQTVPDPVVQAAPELANVVQAVPDPTKVIPPLPEPTKVIPPLPDPTKIVPPLPDPTKVIPPPPDTSGVPAAPGDGPSPGGGSGNPPGQPPGHGVTIPQSGTQDQSGQNRTPGRSLTAAVIAAQIERGLRGEVALNSNIAVPAPPEMTGKQSGPRIISISHLEDYLVLLGGLLLFAVAALQLGWPTNRVRRV
jgi:hypothetical protein